MEPVHRDITISAVLTKHVFSAFHYKLLYNIFKTQFLFFNSEKLAVLKPLTSSVSTTTYGKFEHFELSQNLSQSLLSSNNPPRFLRITLSYVPSAQTEKQTDPQGNFVESFLLNLQPQQNTTKRKRIYLNLSYHNVRELFRC